MLEEFTKASGRAQRRLRRNRKPVRLFALRIPGLNGEPTIVVEACDANYTHQTGHSRIDVEVRQGNRIVFPYGQLCCAVNRWTSIDGIEARELALSLVAMHPSAGGGEGADYYAGYTPAQIEWAERYGEHLDMVREDRYCDPSSGEVRR